MHDTRKPNWECLRNLASEQKGYFTAAQAKRCGYDWSLLSHRATSGSFVRIKRGLYRLRDFPSSPGEEVMAAWLAADKDSSVVSHESALAIHGLSDLISSSTHLTVPRERRWYEGGEGVTIHTTTQRIPRSDIVVRDGIAVTAPARSIADSAEWGTPLEHIETAVRDALRRGLTTRSRILEEAEARGGKVEALLRRLVKDVDDAL